MVFIGITYCQLPKALKEVRLLLRKTFIIAACLVAFIAFHVITIFVRIYSTKHTQYKHFSMCVVHATSQSISFLLFPSGFLLCFYSMTAMLSNLCCCKKGFQRENAVHSHDKNPALSTLGPTVPRSTRISPPSNTFFNVSYTNGFTHISTEIEVSLLNHCEHDFEASIDVDRASILTTGF